MKLQYWKRTFIAYPINAPRCRSTEFGSNIPRGVMYQSKNRSPNPCVSRTVDSGTFSRIWGTMAPESRIKREDRPADNRFPRAKTSPHKNPVTGANHGHTVAIPSVANSDALKYPRWKVSCITTDKS